MSISDAQLDAVVYLSVEKNKSEHYIALVA